MNYQETIASIRAELDRRTVAIEEGVRELEALGEHALFVDSRVLDDLERSVDRLRRARTEPTRSGIRA